MLATILTVLPIFAVIAAGFVCGRTGLLGEKASSEFNRYVVYLALPAVLFEAMAKADWAALWQPGFLVAFAAVDIAVYAAVVALRLRRGRSLADAAIDALNAAYANTAYVGIPVCQAAFGPGSLVFATVATLFTVCVLFAVAVIAVEIDVQEERRPHLAARKVALALAKNPLLIAPVAGALWSLTGRPVPGAVAAFVHLLAGSATPCALMALGLFLAARRPGERESRPDASAFALMGVKLVVQPLLTAVVAYPLLRLAPETAGLAVLLAALPTGTGPFMLAEYYDREAVTTSHAILLSTAASVMTITVVLTLIHAAGGSGGP